MTFPTDIKACFENEATKFAEIDATGTALPGVMPVAAKWKLTK